MIRVPFDPEQLAGEERVWWERWQARADAATAELMSADNADLPRDFKEEVWAALKHWLFTHVFHGKCAYCEGKVTPQSYGDAEHWRPKAGVTIKVDGRAVPVDDGQDPHPGYWWLAYDWSNLLPACSYCNAGHGKQTQFPITGRRVFTPLDAADVNDLDIIEQPLLLHPFRGPDPAEHLVFDDFGSVKAAEDSALGAETISVLDLERGWLREDRLGLLQKAEHGFNGAVLTLLNSPTSWNAVIEPWIAADRPYSLAVRQFMERKLEAFIARFSPEAPDAAEQRI